MTQQDTMPTTDNEAARRPPATANYRPSSLAMDSLATSVMILFGLALLQRVVGFGRNVLFCRWLDSDELGQWNIAFGFLTLVAPAAVLGLPEVLGRYVAYYRLRGQLRVLMARVTIVASLAAIVTTILIFCFRASLSDFLFGSRDQSGLVVVLAVALISLVASSLVIKLFTALRLQRIASGLTFINGMAFAAFGIGFLLTWQCSAESVLLAFAAAGMITLLVSLCWLGRVWADAPLVEAAEPAATFWAKILPFTIWVWLAGGMANLFGVVDRYMLIHFSDLGPDEALAAVGQYHTALFLPLPLLDCVAMLIAVVTPHLSAEWEAGQRDAVCRRLTLMLKLTVLCLSGAMLALLLASPLIFDVAMSGKFSSGQAILSWTLACAVWGGTIQVAMLYLVCCEKAKLSSVALCAGLVANVVLNYFLLPRFVLLGAVVSMMLAQILVLIILLAFNRCWGMPLDFRLIVLLVLPAAFLAPPWATVAILGGALLLVVSTDLLLSRDEKRVLIHTGSTYRNKIPLPNWRGAPALCDTAASD